MVSIAFIDAYWIKQALLMTGKRLRGEYRTVASSDRLRFAHMSEYGRIHWALPMNGHVQLCGSAC